MCCLQAPEQKKRNITRNNKIIKVKKAAIKSYQKEIKENEALRNEWPKVPFVLQGKNISENDELARLTLMNKHGSKMSKIIEWLNDCIKEDDDNRFILFSKVSFLRFSEKFIHERTSHLYSFPNSSLVI